MIRELGGCSLNLLGASAWLGLQCVTLRLLLSQRLIGRLEELPIWLLL